MKRRWVLAPIGELFIGAQVDLRRGDRRAKRAAKQQASRRRRIPPTACDVGPRLETRRQRTNGVVRRNGPSRAREFARWRSRREPGRSVASRRGKGGRFDRKAAPALCRVASTRQCERAGHAGSVARLDGGAFDQGSDEWRPGDGIFASPGAKSANLPLAKASVAEGLGTLADEVEGALSNVGAVGR